MTIEEALFAYLSAYANLTALVGTRIYPLMLPQSPTLPAVTYFQVSGRRVRTFGGSQGATKRFQFSCWGETYASAKAVANQVRLALDHYDGTMGGGSGVPVRGVFLENEVDLYEPETKLYHTAVDFRIITSE